MSPLNRPLLVLSLLVAGSNLGAEAQTLPGGWLLHSTPTENSTEIACANYSNSNGLSLPRLHSDEHEAYKGLGLRAALQALNSGKYSRVSSLARNLKQEPHAMDCLRFLQLRPSFF